MQHKGRLWQVPVVPPESDKDKSSGSAGGEYEGDSPSSLQGQTMPSSCPFLPLLGVRSGWTGKPLHYLFTFFYSPTCLVLQKLDEDYYSLSIYSV